ncbi:M48 family metalloprotease [Alkalilimnicola ehrlichii MLHE-1]|uniref:Peptidase M48, Ste24p n=1 Tax=Alkalilimnicola ehrlichii (strain ATCC BAA-1101 / DSM 17681 / MLHE-1) TaxID=187272 RepID=Q0AAB6_ALKEH|nr:M48 family metallopeptidase [Alkalilimnicola ehrlichii]ABI56221.1 peptidase M48, Ste24p [Alkalilimnicola ehrlichii MLHE-1]
MRILNRIFVLVLLALVLTACAANPVTGQRELALLSEREEVAIGEQHYDTTQQSMGGPYTTDEALNRYINRVGQSLAEVSDRPHLPYEFVVINDSTPNAWALPGGKMGINRGLLLEMDSEAELAAVLGHEIVHAAARHGAQRVERGLLLQAGIMAVGIGASAADRDIGPLLVAGAGIGATLIMQRYSRHHELEADRFGMEYMARAGYDPQGAVDLMETFLRMHDRGDPSWLEGLFASHPPSRERLEANRQTVRELQSRCGECRMGREAYQQAIAGLRERQEAFEAHDRAREALRAGNTAEAMRLADQAVQRYPDEAIFHGLRGDILSVRGQHGQAVRAYDRALVRNSEYFAFHLGRGMAHNELGNHSQARRDLERSNDLLPNAVAHNALGKLALAAGDTDRARGHFTVAAQSNSPEGREAQARLQRLQ